MKTTHLKLSTAGRSWVLIKAPHRRPGFHCVSPPSRLRKHNSPLLPKRQCRDNNQVAAEEASKIASMNNAIVPTIIPAGSQYGGMVTTPSGVQFPLLVSTATNQPIRLFQNLGPPPRTLAYGSPGHPPAFAVIAPVSGLISLWGTTSWSLGMRTENPDWNLMVRSPV